MIIPVDCAKLLYVTNTQKQSFKRDRLKNSQIGIVKKNALITHKKAGKENWENKQETTKW